MIEDKYTIEQLIPQRTPMLLVDRLERVDKKKCITSYTVRDDCALFSEGCLSEVGVIEHMAQSASALAGYKSLENGATELPLGMIGEVKKFDIFASPKKGQRLTTEITMGITVGEITNVSAKTFVGERIIASTAFKIVLK